MAQVSRAFKLFRLQQIDSQLDEAQDRLREIKQSLEQDEVIREARQAVEASKNSMQHAYEEMRSAEEEVKAQQEHIAQNQANLYSGRVTNPKELQDLQKEADALKHRLSDLENNQLEKMIALEEAQAALKKAEERLETARAERGVEERTLGSEQNKLTAEAARLQEERATAISGIAAKDLELYQGLRTSKGRLAVSKVQNKICTACGAELSAALAQAARSPEELVTCSNCKRILYAG